MESLAGVLLGASATGLAVVLVTALAQRLGPTVGGLLATAPVTTTAALLWLTAQQGNQAVAADVLRGAGSLVAATFAMPLFAVAVRHAPGGRHVRTGVALMAFVALFTALALLAATQVPRAWAGLWPIMALAVAGAAALRHPVEPVPAGPESATGSRMRGGEAVARFLAGAGVILLVEALRQIHPALGTAWAVFPGTFLVTLGVLSLRQGPEVGAQAAIGALRGIPALVAYLLMVWALLPLAGAAAWAWAVQAPAWGVYFLVLAAARRRALRPPEARAASRPGPAS